MNSLNQAQKASQKHSVVRIDPDLAAKAQNLRKNERRSLTGFVNNALAVYIELKTTKPEIIEPLN